MGNNWCGYLSMSHVWLISFGTCRISIFSRKSSAPKISICLSRVCPHWGEFPLINTLRPRENCRHFADCIFKCILFNENVWISPKLALKFVPKVSFDNILALLQIMAWRRSGDKSLSEPMMVSLLAHICFARPQWFNAYTWQSRISQICIYII